ncbi:hypothetical protein EGH21_22195 [Halomicroarcula sp. F13]|uniref:DUF8009 domain-containing protein n=1 Tax=Haloarcula rubra TaxID=2487747 RepID=A0AAW4PX40_9EURY|nr:hypothetical protein [Halomicroarcula rubra]MBX0325731.1 hypothetical protein [Halomicroarcula rubra]
MAPDPSVVRSLAVSAEDLVAALEANTRDGPETVLRATPPYSGRMRARLHVVQADGGDDETLHVAPERLVADTAPPYPTPDDTADELRAGEETTYSVERHRTYHERRVDEWRAEILDHVVETVTVAAVDHELTGSLLGP